MYKYLIESSAWVEYLGGSAKGKKVKELIESEAVATSVISIAELADKFEREGLTFQPSLNFMHATSAILPITVDICVHAAAIKKEQRTLSPKFGLADALHLATARREKARLITSDGDFRGSTDVVLI
ncbi:PIN domain-containing protein [Candidatus Woesearchaeota archaeon]|nr:PIN domain-containing protein [Candidatus Woesearchaeota archaeon]